MSTITIADRRTGVGTGDVTLARVIYAEWTKLWSLRSTRWTLGLAVLLVIGIDVLATAQAAQQWTAADVHGGTADPTFQSLGGLLAAQIPIGVLGVLTLSGEYATGMIHATFGLVPRRLPVLWAKTIVFAGVTFVLMLATLLIAFLIGQSILGPDLNVGLGSPHVIGAILGSAAYLTLIGVVGLALGALLRHTAGAVSTLLGAMLALPVLFEIFGQWLHSAERYLPMLVAEAVASTQPTHVTDLLSPAAALLAMCGYAVVGLGAAALVLVRRDV